MRVRHRWFAPLLFGSLAAVGLGCRSDTPTAPDAAPAQPAVAAATGPLSFRQVSAGFRHTCAVATDDRAWCWGINQYGQLGNGNAGGPQQCNSTSGPKACSTRPVAVAGGHRFRRVAAGSEFTCGLTTDDRIFCWGRGELGQLGSGGNELVNPRPLVVAGGRHYRDVAGGENFACAVTLARVAFCWGFGNSGQLGNGDISDSRVPVRVAGQLEWTQVTAGSFHGCGITTAQRVWCWGDNIGGRIGDGTTVQRHVPTRVAGDLAVVQVDAGEFHSCALTTAQRAFCWGSGFGSLGDGTGDGNTVITRLTPTAVVGDRSWTAVSAGGGHTCGITVFKRGFCWGVNAVGQLGDGTTTARNTPTPIDAGLQLVSVTTGQGHSCAVNLSNGVWCWGVNDMGQLGNGTRETRVVPTLVVGHF
jgi:alpha-tubulin suppressor-like RCC1 family protein